MVVGESSRVARRLELVVLVQLGERRGYDGDISWGHISSGGTVANFEALWIARNIFCLPVAAAGAAAELGIELQVTRPDGTRVGLDQLGLWELLNIRNDDVMDLWEGLWQM